MGGLRSCGMLLVPGHSGGETSRDHTSSPTFVFHEVDRCSNHRADDHIETITGMNPQIAQFFREGVTKMMLLLMTGMLLHVPHETATMY